MRRIKTTAMIFILLYLAASFIHMSLNPFQWDIITRIALVVVLVGCEIAELLESSPQRVDPADTREIQGGSGCD